MFAKATVLRDSIFSGTIALSPAFHSAYRKNPKKTAASTSNRIILQLDHWYSVPAHCKPKTKHRVNTMFKGNPMESMRLNFSFRLRSACSGRRRSRTQKKKTTMIMTPIGTMIQNAILHVVKRAIVPLIRGPNDRAKHSTLPRMPV